MRDKTGLRPNGDAFDTFLLQEAFVGFARSASEFSERASSLAGSSVKEASVVSAHTSLRITRRIFSKWSIEILTLLYANGSMRFQEIRKSLDMISTGVLAKKLNALQEKELIERSVLNSKPPASRYSLTEKGFTVIKLSEPLLLYLRFQDGLLSKDG